MKIAILLPYEYDRAPSQRFRWEQWQPYFEQQQIDVTRVHFSTERINRLKQSGSLLQFAIAFLCRYCVWFFSTLRLTRDVDFVVVHRNAAFFGPPLIETILSLLGRRLIYDLDDAIYLPPEAGDGPIDRVLRCNWRVGSISRRSDLVGLGNRILMEYVSQFQESLELWPTSIDLNLYRPGLPRASDEQLPVVGWTGSVSTADYIEFLLPQLAELQQTTQFELLIIGAEFDLASCGISGSCIPWKPETEVSDLQRIDIGLMPLFDTAWSRGKCALKALQYQALAIPTVVSDVGMNKDAVLHDVTGIVVSPGDSWIEPLQRLLLDPSLRQQMGQRGRKHVEDNYSAEVVTAKVIADLRGLLSQQDSLPTRAQG